ncbi:uncharacterized protein JKF63_07972 [Porcisia hertigi]|uniref:Folate/biopterin transporter n=1 Tax=Porcisia hertigi TaxID=2761500 RepID=A0A836KWJ5_9TRYP|nr:hypothetical protein JKF63_07972 [Porcisia hertigi]
MSRKAENLNAQSDVALDTAVHADPEATVTGNKGKDIHPEAASLFAACPWTRKVPVFGEAVGGYGPKVIIALGASYLLSKGIADQILRGQTYAMMIDRYGISVPRYQRLSPICMLGLSIKAFTAMLCDGFAFLGYTKRWYMFVSCVAGGTFALIYGLLPARAASANVACAFIFLSCWGKANVDILSEGHYSRLMRQNPSPGPAMVSWIWFWIMVGWLVGTIMNGPLADAGKPQISIFVSAALQIITCVLYLFNWYGEKKNRVLRSEDALYLLDETRKERERLGLDVLNGDGVGTPHRGAGNGKKSPPRAHLAECVEAGLREVLNDDLADGHELAPVASDDDDDDVSPEEVYYGKPPVPCLFGLFEINTEVISKNWRVFVYSIVMTCAVIAMLCCNILSNTLGLLIACIVVSTICCSASFWALPLVIAKANIFGYFQTAVYIRVTSPVSAFYLNSYQCPGNLPNFSYSFYNTVAGVISSVVGVITVPLFNFVFAKHGYRLTLIVTTIMQVLGGLVDIIIVKRWNLYIGIPDHAMYIWGDAVVGELVYMLGFMPMIVLLSRLCPRGSESVVYALMAGFSNLGRTTSSSLGAIIMEYGWPVFPDKDRCNYDNLPLLLFVCNMCTPLLVIPLSVLLLPKTRICDNIDLDSRAVRDMVDKELLAASLSREDPVSGIANEPSRMAEQR